MSNFISKDKLDTMTSDNSNTQKLEKKKRYDNFEEKVKKNMVKKVNIPQIAQVCSRGSSRQKAPSQKDIDNIIRQRMENIQMMQMTAKQYHEWRDSIRNALMACCGKIEGKDSDSFVDRLKGSRDINSILLDNLLSLSPYVESNQVTVLLSTVLSKYLEFKCC